MNIAGAPVALLERVIVVNSNFLSLFAPVIII